MTNPSTQNSISTSPTVAHVRASTFTKGGNRITVTMIDPIVDFETKPIFTGDVGNPREWGMTWNPPPRGFTEPHVIAGNYCPAKFEAEGLKYSITFSIGFIDGKWGDESLMMVVRKGLASRSRIGITSLTVYGDSIERKYLANIPTALLLDHALHASTFIATAYPANYRTVVNGVTTFDSGPTGTFVPRAYGVGPYTTQHLRNLEGFKPQGRKAYASSWHSPEMIDAAVEFFNSCPDGYPGGRTEYVRLHLETKTDHRYAASTISRMFAKAREDGKLSPVLEKYKYHRKKGGKK